ncbi:hypothetical protein ACIBG8_44530 [Nonomuraea sp. NPDC050556]|uniref:hypothetical protein n=1 Tax=Nonomuraea sp. NPDC050556 TaxID=3364369 RepID=UPI0037AF78C1
MRRVWLILLAILTLSACSPTWRPSVDEVQVRGRDLVATFEDGGAVSSRDGGRTWQPSDAPSLTTQTSMCVPKKARCYMIDPGRLKVLESDDGKAWRTSWEIPSGQAELLGRNLGGTPQSVSLAVQATSRGHVVAVANQADGLAIRDEDGVWRRVAFDDDHDVTAPVDLDQNGPIGIESWVALMVGAWVLLAGFAIASGRAGLAALASIGFLALVIGVPTAAFSADGPFSIAVLCSFALAGMLTGSWITAGLRGRALGTVLGTGVLVSLGVLAPFRAWSMGLLPGYDIALQMSVGLGLLFVLVGLALVYRWGRSDR